MLCARKKEEEGSKKVLEEVGRTLAEREMTGAGPKGEGEMVRGPRLGQRDVHQWRITGVLRALQPCIVGPDNARVKQR